MDAELESGRNPVSSPKDSMFWPFLARDSKIDAGLINREFLDWLSQRREPARPFFAFLNYFDAHSAYMLPPGAPYRFGRPPKTEVDVQVVVDWYYIDKLRLPPSLRKPGSRLLRQLPWLIWTSSWVSSSAS